MGFDDIALPALTVREQQVFDILRSGIREMGFAPSVREIASLMGFRSPSAVQPYIRSLMAKGYIERDASKPRAIRLLGGFDDPTYDEKLQSLHNAGELQGITMLPLVGRVAAGTPILAEENVEAMVPLPRSLIGDDASFVLRVQGDSMIRAGIYDGDFIVVREQSSAENGQIVVALIEDSATVKTFYLEKDRVRLQPENPLLEPIFVVDPIILGRVIALVRSF